MRRDVGALTDGTFDLVILGGGITGAGVALDAASRGLRVALIDKGDFASGTSSLSSKLVHGGLRYLEHGHFHLVYEALRERGLLLRNAAHLVRPLRFIIPFYQGHRVPSWKWRLGLTFYDFLARRANIKRSRPLSLHHLHCDFPDLQTHQLQGGAEFHDAQMDDARLCLEVVRTATEFGAWVANYVEAVGFEMRSGEIQGVRAVDRVTGRELLVRARHVLNATGPWVDAICQMAGDTSGPRLQPTKGVHVIAPGRSLAAAFLLLHPRDGRVFFVLPWLGKTLIGTTDTFTTTGPDRVTVAAEDIAYLLEGYNHHFRQGLGTGDLLGSFAGLRPLIRARTGEPSALSREYRLFAAPSGLISVAGGKYTTYRHMAEEITDVIVKRLGKRRRCRTRNLLLDGAPRQSWPIFWEEGMRQLGRFGLPLDSVRHLLGRYGRRAPEVAAYLAINPDLARRVHPDEPELGAELAYQRDHEMALFPADHWLRRTRLGLYRPEVLAAGYPTQSA